MISNVMFVSDFYCHVWVSSLQVHFSCDSSSLASCLQFQYLAQSGRWCLLGSPMWLTDDWTHISFHFTCIYICTSDALSLANDTHPFASSLIISVYAPQNGRIKSQGIHTGEVFCTPPGCPPERLHHPPPHHQRMRLTVPGWPTDCRRMTMQLIFSASGEGDTELSIRIGRLCSQPLPRYWSLSWSVGTGVKEQLSRKSWILSPGVG